MRPNFFSLLQVNKDQDLSYRLKSISYIIIILVSCLDPHIMVLKRCVRTIVTVLKKANPQCCRNKLPKWWTHRNISAVSRNSSLSCIERLPGQFPGVCMPITTLSHSDGRTGKMQEIMAVFLQQGSGQGGARSHETHDLYGLQSCQLHYASLNLLFLFSGANMSMHWPHYDGWGFW